MGKEQLRRKYGQKEIAEERENRRRQPVAISILEASARRVLRVVFGGWSFR